MREEYYNGDPIALKHCGCDGCSPVVIQGLFCHEIGCPEAWRDETRECRECGAKFHPSERHQQHCADCQDEGGRLCIECGNPTERPDCEVCDDCSDWAERMTL